ncbi:MAG: YqgE/AlgH family protein [Gammaproteobacteria bacterium]|nr:YqgE/AlgH family protein [Gammaproteobacteria bacterium]
MSDRLSLNNQFLIAMPSLNDPNFQQSVSYICEHNDEGAMGIVINRLTDLTFSDLCDQLDIEITDTDVADVPIYHGGPVEVERGFILHTPIGEWESTLAVTKDIGLTMSKDIIQAIADGYDSDNTPPEHFIITLGYAGWSEDQIEDEIAENVWLNVPASKDILFSTPVIQRWNAAAALLGINLQQLSTEIGHS